jgi:hypothetical protein
MKGTSCFKTDFVNYKVKRKVTGQYVKYRSTFYTHKDLKPYEGKTVIVVEGWGGLRLYDARRKLICVAKEKKIRSSKCRVCGCTHHTPCINMIGEPCHWVEKDLCSCCAASEGVATWA